MSTVCSPEIICWAEPALEVGIFVQLRKLPLGDITGCSNDVLLLYEPSTSAASVSERFTGEDEVVSRNSTGRKDQFIETLWRGL